MLGLGVEVSDLQSVRVQSRTKEKGAARRALVIGAGPGGLAAAAALKTKGLDFVLVDRESRPGGAYRDLYPANPMISPKAYLEIGGFRLEDPAHFVSTGRFQTYLEDFAEHHDLKPLARPVTEVLPRDSDFSVTFADGAKERFTAVILATGCVAHPNLPDIPGQDDFQTETIHSKFWQGPTGLRSVLVVGSGISGTEIAEECARAGIRTTMSARNKPRFVNPQPLGVDLLDWSRPFERLPIAFFPKLCSGSKGRKGYDRGIRRFLKEGTVALAPGIERMEGKTVFFKNGSSDQFDKVVFATGYDFKIPVLPKGYRDLSDHNLSKIGESREFPGLFFIGFRCAHGIDSQYIRGITRAAPLMAKRTADVFSTADARK